MKNASYLLVLVILTIFSCRKDPSVKIETPNEPSSFDLVTTQGSWWKYDWFKIDSLGNETLTTIKDCVYVVGDTLINGNTFTHLHGDFHIFNSYDWFWRDSAHYIVNQNGQKLYSTIEGIDTLEIIEGTEVNNYFITDGTEYEMTVPAGTFNVYDSELHYSYNNGSPFTNCEDTWVKHTKFANGIGMISTQTGFISQIQTQCSYDESRLTEYYIAP
ncbi:hypothetical protein K6119_11995 [Paracrocinitomix mangrovi]|uniref:hypothetical protein n=1 Tax=Paracrocinitomix mangrovi TaxID=2862509 RepID=UPI001C8D11FD|nr:hypothetical protein [Paracrocinitomix mangrovi]UKN00453.1 hypothetical protein K6119_11995 [Paracrocinitomix mangrovi]